MATQTESFAKSWNSIGKIHASFTSPPSGAIPSQASIYQIEEQQPVKTPVPFDSSLSVVAHFVKWTTWAAYIALRLRSIYESSDCCLWVIYLCEVAFGLHELQSAFELSLSLLGPRKDFEHTQYILRGSRAPKVHVLITVCGEDLSTVLDTIAAAAVQRYSPTQFQVFVLDDAADDGLRKAIDSMNTSNRARKSEYQDIVYFARKKPLGKRHYYKSGNLRAGLEFTASHHGSSEYFAALDADMISEPDWLARTVPHLIRNGDVALVSPPQISYNILKDDELCQDSNVYAQILEPSRDFFGCSQCSGSGYVMRRRALDTIGGWPLANIGEDILCSNMLQEQGWRTQYIPDQLQFGQAPDSFHSCVNQRIRWTFGSLLVGNRSGFSLRRLIRGNRYTRIQHILSVMGAWKAYCSTLLFASSICLPVSVWALELGEIDCTIGRRHLRLILAVYFIASTISNKLVYGRLGNINVSNMTTNKIWCSPFSAFCTLKSLISDPGDISFKVSGTFVSPTNERYAGRRKPLLKRLINLTMICYMSYFLVTTAILASLFMSVASRNLVVGAKRVHMHTGAALKLVELVLATIVPVRYMVFPPSLPDRQTLLEKDADNVSRSRKKGWTKRDGGSSIKLMLQLAVIVVFDWL